MLGMSITEYSMARPSKVSIPEHAHPHARLVFALMREHRISYDTLEHVSGCLRSTIKSWRGEKVPSIQSIEAVLGAFGWSLVPVPPLSSLSDATREAIEEISLDFKSDSEVVGAALACIASRASAEALKPRGVPYWRAKQGCAA